MTKRQAVTNILVQAMGGNGYSRSCAVPKQIVLHSDQIERLFDCMENYIANELQTYMRHMDSRTK